MTREESELKARFHSAKYDRLVKRGRELHRDGRMDRLASDLSQNMDMIATSLVALEAAAVDAEPVD